MDVQALRDLSRRAAELAGQARLAAGDASRTDQVVWQSTRAQEYRDDLVAEVRGIQEAADELDRAAGALTRHADDVQHRLDQIAAAADWFFGALDDARRTLSGAADDLADGARETAQAFVDAAQSIPSPGSIDWGGFVGRFR